MNILGQGFQGFQNK